MDANITLQQIGTGNLMACGARDFVKSNDELMFRVGSGRKLAKIVITLDPSDTYTVRYVEVSRKDFRITKEEVVSDVFCDMLGEVVRKLGDR